VSRVSTGQQSELVSVNHSFEIMRVTTKLPLQCETIQYIRIPSVKPRDDN